MEFDIRDRVFLKVASWKNIILFKIKGMSASKCIGPFKVIMSIGLITYQLELPPIMSKVYDMFHMLLLWKSHGRPPFVLPQVPIQEDLIMEIKHIRSMDTIGKKELKEWESSFGKGVMEELSSKRKNIGEKMEMKRKHPSLFNN